MSALGPLAALLALAATAWIGGRRLLRPLTCAGELERSAVAMVLGLGLLALVGFLLGLAGLFARGSLLLVLAGVHLACLGEWRGAARAARERLRPAPRRALAALGAAAALSPFVVLALYPPTAFDATLYHLPFARAFVRTGGLPYLPDLRFPVFPQLAEALFAQGMLLAGDVTAHLVSLLATLVTAALLAAWGRAAFGTAVPIAAAAFLGHPIVVYLATTAYVEALLGLFVAAALHAAWRWWASRQAGWLALAGLFAGSAAGVKYLGLFFVGILALAVALSRPRLRALPLFAAGAAAAMLPWYGRILYHTGNPVFPYFPGIFGANPWAPEGMRTVPGLGVIPPGEGLAAAGRWLARVAELPWDVVFERAEVGHMPPFSPALLAALPLVLWGAVRDRLVRRLSLLCLAYGLLFPALPPDARYLAVLLPLFALALEGSVARLPPAARERRLLPAALCLALFLPGWLYAWHRVALQGPLPLGPGARDRYLAERLPLYPAVRHLNRLGGREATVYAFHAEQMRYFAAGRFVGDWFGPARYAERSRAARDPEALYAELRRLGAGYLLVPRDPRSPRQMATPAFRRRFRLVYGDSAAELFALEAPRH